MGVDEMADTLGEVQEDTTPEVEVDTVVRAQVTILYISTLTCSLQVVVVEVDTEGVAEEVAVVMEVVVEEEEVMVVATDVSVNFCTVWVDLNV